jgi:hypothetical protein
MYLWKIKETEGGDVKVIALSAYQAGLTHVLIKIADGRYTYNYDWDKKIDLVPPLVEALRNRGISPWGWHYVRGDAPVAEARKAVQRIRTLELDGYVIDAEHEYKGRYAEAKAFMTMLRKELPSTPIALSSYRYPSYHPRLPWKQFLEKCDFNMPQVYWERSHNPAIQLRRCLKEFRGMVPNRPVFPTGAAYTERLWVPTADEVVEFMNTSRDEGLAGANFWEFAASKRVGLWDTIAGYHWPGTPLPVKDISLKFIEALNSHRPEVVAKLYASSAVHVNASRTVQGLERIKAWYADFFRQVLPDATFALTGYSGTGSSRHVTWAATSSKGNVLNGNDTFGLNHDQIIYHYTYFTLAD